MAVELFDEGRLWYFDALSGERDGSFYAPYTPAARQQLSRDKLRQELEIFGRSLAGTPTNTAPERPERDLVALIDSGIITNHPLLRPRIVASRDFTQEGIEDHWGHGTMRALMTLWSQPTARFLIAKVVGRNPGERKALIAALDWTVEAGAGVLWLALGEYNIFCRGGCPLCRAATRATDAGCVVIAAPGNRPGRVACPAKARGVTPTVATPYHMKKPADYLDRVSRLRKIPNYFEPS